MVTSAPGRSGIWTAVGLTCRRPSCRAKAPGERFRSVEEEEGEEERGEGG